MREMIANGNGSVNASQFNSKMKKAPTHEERLAAQVSALRERKTERKVLF